METALAKYDPNQSLTLQKISEGLFSSGLFPNTKSKFGAFAIIEYGHELGIPPMMALKNINIISGQLACNAQLMLTLAMAKGVTYDVKIESDKGAKINFKRGSSTYEASFMEDDAKAAGLTGKDNWKKYPRDMYFWRCVAKGVRRIAPDAVMGLYTAEEITEGKVVSIVEMPTEKTEPVKAKEPPPTVETAVEDVPEYPEFAKAPVVDAILEMDSPQHKLIEAKINESGIDRDSLKEYLYHIGKLELKGDKPSFSTITVANASKLLDKWDITVKAHDNWLGRKAA
jgi:hypothetical protein